MRAGYVNQSCLIRIMIKYVYMYASLMHLNPRRLPQRLRVLILVGLAYLLLPLLCLSVCLASPLLTLINLNPLIHKSTNASTLTLYTHSYHSLQAPDARLFSYTNLRMLRPGIARALVEDNRVVVYHCMDNSREIFGTPLQVSICMYVYVYICECMLCVHRVEWFITEP